MSELNDYGEQVFATISWERNGSQRANQEPYLIEEARPYQRLGRPVRRSSTRSIRCC